jgi:hypothetical protein
VDVDYFISMGRPVLILSGLFANAGRIIIVPTNFEEYVVLASSLKFYLMALSTGLICINQLHT